MFELLFGCLDNNTYGTYKIKKNDILIVFF